jgi:hypothetical protein
VAFVSLTVGARQQAEVYVKTFALPWPCGYDVSLPFLGRIGAYNRPGRSENPPPGYVVIPTLYLISPGGRILWNDGQARPQHTKEGEVLVREIDDAIERALADR